MSKIWMACGRPPLLLPEAVADSAEELARCCGVSVSSIRQYISHRKQGVIKRAERYLCIEIEEEDDDD